MPALRRQGAEWRCLFRLVHLNPMGANWLGRDDRLWPALFVEYKAFAWAASLRSSPTDEENLRRHLLLFSLKDQGRDSRDALLCLQDLCREARSAGVNPGPVLREVAELSSHRNKYGMGSTREMLLRASQA